VERAEFAIGEGSEFLPPALFLALSFLISSTEFKLTGLTRGVTPVKGFPGRGDTKGLYSGSVC
jgi:hypothetical protein